MNTKQITNALLHNKSTRKYFQGVFSSDQLPKRVFRRPAIIIANTDPSYKSGQHWIAFYFHDFKTAEYFDSYGQQPLNSEFLKFLNCNSKKITINKQQIQGYFSDTCGHYCLLYSLYKSKNKSMKLFVNQFKSTDYNFNDKKVVKQCKKFFSF